MPQKFLLFSGHNDRAAIALCRFFEANGLDFVVVARATNDMIRNSRYRNRIIFTRETPTVDFKLFVDVAHAAGGCTLIYCPTTEFINLFLLDNCEQIKSLGYQIHLPDAQLYHTITNKKSAADFFSDVQGLSIPEEFALETATVPCVVKPKENLWNGQMLYPQIIHSPEDLQAFQDTHDPSAFFFQHYVEGCSIYFCGCLDITGAAVGFWQRNLGQQTGGKSIVLAREETDVPSSLKSLQDALVHQLSASGYFGPFMVEIRRNSDTNYFIEINPRFWGPLQLAIDVCPQLLEKFVQMSVPDFSSVSKRNLESPCYYIWKGGMTNWEALESASDRSVEIENIDAWDVFERKDYKDVEIA